MSNWLVLAFASQGEFAAFLANPGSLKLSQMKEVENASSLMNAIRFPNESPPVPVNPSDNHGEKKHVRRTGKHITISSLVHNALDAAPPTPFKANAFAKAVLGNAGLRCSSRNMKNVYHLLAKEASAGHLRRVKRGLYNKTHSVAQGPGIVHAKKRSAKATSKK